MRPRTITSPSTTDGPTTLGLHPLITAGATTTIPGTAITTITISRIPPILLRPPGSLTTSSLRTSELPMKRAWPERLARSEEHTSELQSRFDLVCRLLLEKKKHFNFQFAVSMNL